MPRNRLMAACACPLIRPGITIAPCASMIFAASYLAFDFGARADGHDGIGRERQRPRLRSRGRCASMVTTVPPVTSRSAFSCADAAGESQNDKGTQMNADEHR